MFRAICTADGITAVLMNVREQRPSLRPFFQINSFILQVDYYLTKKKIIKAL